MGAPVSWFEITSTNPDGLTAFYRDLFDWTITASPEPGYALVDAGAGDDALGGGIGATASPHDS